MRLASKLVAASLLLIVSAGAVSAAQVDVESGFTQPSEVEAGSTVQNQLFNVNIHSLSADGDTDYVYFQFPNEFEGNLSLNSVDSNISISSSKTLVDYDNDSLEETAKVGLSRDGEGNVTGNVTLDATVSYSPEFDQAEVNVQAVDSSNGEDSAKLEVVDMEQETSDSQNTSDTEESTDTEQTENDSTTEETDSADETDTENNTTDSEQSDPVDESESDSTDNNQTQTDEETDNTEENGTTETDNTEDTTNSTDSEETDSQESSGDQGIIASIVSFFTGLF